MGGESAFRCTVCGYVHEGAAPPDCCPVCGAAPSDFEPFAPATSSASAVSAPTAWRCLNCSYVHEGPEPPAECPLCGAPKDRFEPVAPPQADTARDDGGFDGHLVVVGAGIAGISAIESFRQHASGGTVTLLAKEAILPYYRLNLTRFLAGEIDRDALAIHPAAWYDERNIDLRLGAEAAAIDLETMRLALRDGNELPFDRIVLAAGAHPFIPPIVGAQREGVTSLRTVADAEAILAQLRPGMRCVCIGGGLLGLETAGALAQRGASVTLLEGHDWLMPRQLNRRAGEILAGHLEGIGVTLLRNARTKEILGDERVGEVLLQDGARVAADLVVIATGVRPNSHLARRMGLDVNKGVVVDNHLLSSHPELLAAGDVAEHHGTLYGSWAASQFQGAIAGMNAAGLRAEFGGLPRSNALKVLGLDVCSIGQVEPEDGSFEALESEDESGYHRFVIHDGKLVGAVMVGDATAATGAKHAIEAPGDFAETLRAHGDAKALAEAFRARL